MKIRKTYRQSLIPATKIKDLHAYVNSKRSRSLGEQWGHKLNEYVLGYPSRDVQFENITDVAEAIVVLGDTHLHCTRYESRTGRSICVDALDPTRIIVEVNNGKLTSDTLNAVEELLGLEPMPRRVFISHGRSSAWHEVVQFIEKEVRLDLKVIELAQMPNKGRTVVEKLRDESNGCSYAVIVMTAEDLTADGNLRTRENVMHEIGFFQGRYGFDRVCLLREEGTNIPSNLAGLVNLPFARDGIRATFADLQRELRVAFEAAAT